MISCILEQQYLRCNFVRPGSKRDWLSGAKTAPLRPGGPPPPSSNRWSGNTMRYMR